MKWYELHNFICTQLKEKGCGETESLLNKLASTKSYKEAISEFNEAITLTKKGLNKNEIAQLKSFINEYRTLCKEKGLNNLEERNLTIEISSYIIEKGVSGAFAALLDNMEKDIADLEIDFKNETLLSSKEIEQYTFDLIDSYYQKVLIIEEISPHADFLNDCYERKYFELKKIDKLNKKSDWRVKLTPEKALELIQEINIEKFRKPNGKFIITPIARMVLDQNPDVDISERRLRDIIKSLIENGEIE